MNQFILQHSVPGSQICSCQNIQVEILPLTWDFCNDWTPRYFTCSVFDTFANKCLSKNIYRVCKDHGLCSLSYEAGLHEEELLTKPDNQVCSETQRWRFHWKLRDVTEFLLSLISEGQGAGGWCHGWNEMPWTIRQIQPEYHHLQNCPLIKGQLMQGSSPYAPVSV